MHEFARGLFTYFGAADDVASLVADHLVESSRMGVHSHGLMRIPEYVDAINSGTVDPKARPVVVRADSPRIAVNGHRTFGQLVGMEMAKLAVDGAAGHGVTFVTGFDMGHTGRLGAYVDEVARAGFLGVAGWTAIRDSSAHWVAPFGGREGRLATNPLAYAFPVADDDTLVADLATSTTAEGVVRWLCNNGREAPPGTLRDAEGRPVSDPAELYRRPRGTIEVLGGTYYGHKGMALALLPSVLALAGADDGADPTKGQMFVLAVKVGSRFRAEAAWLADYIRSCSPIDPTRKVMMPGDREKLAAAGSRDVRIDLVTWDALGRLGRRVGLRRPKGRVIRGGPSPSDP